MKATELRIGNWIQGYHAPEDIGQVTAEHFSTVDPDGYIDGDGIPLTPEILENAGFEFVMEAGGYCDKNHILYTTNTHIIFCPYCTKDENCYINIIYLHQLQNLYFALTGEELEVKL